MYSYRRKKNKKQCNTDAEKSISKLCKCPIYAVEYKDENKKAAELPFSGNYRRINEQIRVCHLSIINFIAANFCGVTEA